MEATKYFDFLRLPPPVRNIIYDYALRIDEMIYVTTRQNKDSLLLAAEVRVFSGNREDHDTYPLSALFSPALLFVCRQLFQECVGIVYENTFAFDHSKAMSRFAKTIWQAPSTGAGRFITRIACNNAIAGVPYAAFQRLGKPVSLRSIEMWIVSWGSQIRGLRRGAAISVSDTGRFLFSTVSPMFDGDYLDEDEWFFERLSFDLPSYAPNVAFEEGFGFDPSHVAPLTAETKPLLLDKMRDARYEAWCVNHDVLG